MQIEHEERYDQFMDTVKLSLLMWRKAGKFDFAKIAEKLGSSERTVRRRFQSPETLTLEELYAWCELYDKDPVELLCVAAKEARKKA